MPEIAIFMPEAVGTVGQLLFLRDVSNGDLINAGGDTLAENPASSGRFVADVSESLPALAAVSVTSGGLAVRDGWLVDGETTVRDAYPSAAGGGGTDWTAEERAQIRYRLGLNGTATAPTDPVPDPIVVTPGTGNLTTGFLTVYDENGTAETGVSIHCRLINSPDGDTGAAYDTAERSDTSDENGLVQFPVHKGATYQIWRGIGRGRRFEVTIPSDAGTTYALPSIFGVD